MQRIQALKDEIASGRTFDPSSVDSRLITENEEVMFETINAPLEMEEVTRLREASTQLEGLLELDNEDEEDPEMELALLQMFVDQGDIDKTTLPKTGKV